MDSFLLFGLSGKREVTRISDAKHVKTGYNEIAFLISMAGTLILVRHGRSLWNSVNRFTGWIDVPLDAQGWNEAERAGELLADYRFDAAYTSHLQRALVTLHLILHKNRAEKTPIFIPADGTVPRQEYPLKENEFPVAVYVVALAERHYGALQGKNKQEIEAEVGAEQFKKWRRGYDTPPPNGESLKDTLERAVPYFRTEIEPRLARNETVLIAAHGNSLRAVTKYLENIADDVITGLEIPTGTPIIYTIEMQHEKPQIIEKKVLELS